MPLAMVKAVADAIPGAALEIVPGCGHLYLVQDAEATAASLERFLGG